jgi:hypothetical protein
MILVSINVITFRLEAHGWHLFLWLSHINSESPNSMKIMSLMFYFFSWTKYLNGRSHTKMLVSCLSLLCIVSFLASPSVSSYVLILTVTFLSLSCTVKYLATCLSFSCHGLYLFENVASLASMTILWLLKLSTW